MLLLPVLAYPFAAWPMHNILNELYPEERWISLVTFAKRGFTCIGVLNKGYDAAANNVRFE